MYLRYHLINDTVHVAESFIKKPGKTKQQKRKNKLLYIVNVDQIKHPIYINPITPSLIKPRYVHIVQHTNI